MEKPKSNKHIAPNNTDKPTPGYAAKPKIAPTEKGTLVKRKNVAAADPAVMDKPSRSKVKATSGARYGIKVMFQKTTAPEAGATLANAKILPSAIKRSAQTFAAGMSDHS